MADGMHNDFQEPPFEATRRLGELLRANIVRIGQLTEDAATNIVDSLNYAALDPSELALDHKYAADILKPIKAGLSFTNVVLSYRERSHELLINPPNTGQLDPQLMESIEEILDECRQVFFEPELETEVIMTLIDYARPNSVSLDIFILALGIFSSHYLRAKNHKALCV
jgi:hypothetical protein